MARNVKVTAISLPKELVTEIAARMKDLRMRSRSDYFTKLAEQDVSAGGPLIIGVHKPPAANAAATEERKGRKKHKRGTAI